MSRGELKLLMASPPPTGATVAIPRLCHDMLEFWTALGGGTLDGVDHLGRGKVYYDGEG